jgi:hypothetical protein
MSKERIEKESRWGGHRDGSGRPKGSGKKKQISVSVDEEKWNTAIDYWKRKPSWLVDGLVSRYVSSGGSILETEAAL